VQHEQNHDRPRGSLQKVLHLRENELKKSGGDHVSIQYNDEDVLALRQLFVANSRAGLMVCIQGKILDGRPSS
jgi:hypothetical protein